MENIITQGFDVWGNPYRVIFTTDGIYRIYFINLLGEEDWEERIDWEYFLDAYIR